MDLPLPAPEDENESLLAFLYLCPVGILQLNGQGAVQILNPVAVQLLVSIGVDPLGANLFDALTDVAPELRNMIADFGPARGRICSNHRIFLADLDTRLRVLSCTLLKSGPDCIMVMLDDISDQVAQERRLKQADSWMAAIFSGVTDFACFTLDRAGRIDSWNESGRRRTGFSEQEVIGQPLSIFRPPAERATDCWPDQLEGARREGWHLQDGSCRRRDGSQFWSQTLVSLLDGAVKQQGGFAVVLRDVTEHKMSTEEIRRLLTQDHLTGAANRARFFDAAAIEMERWKRARTRFSLVMLDVDHFKSINDTYGHAAGDAVLQALVQSCQAILRPGDTLARFGGEEFVALLPGTPPAEATAIAQRLCDTIARNPVAFERETIAITASAGVATIDDQTPDLNGVLKSADTCLYRAKQSGRNQVASHPRRQPQHA
jgi:diguanylate cyclase (GGDEF)-like protein/PAS domain S-box-containing protein